MTRRQTVKFLVRGGSTPLLDFLSTTRRIQSGIAPAHSKARLRLSRFRREAYAEVPLTIVTHIPGQSIHFTPRI